MSTLTSNSKVVTLSGGTFLGSAQWAEWYDWIVIENLDTSNTVWVATDGSTASASADTEFAIPPGFVLQVANRQAKPAWFTPGTTETATQQSAGATSQQAQNGTDVPTSGYGTYVTLAGAATSVVVVSPQ